MAEPLAVVPALNTMIPLCSLLVFGASVSRSSLVVKVVSKSVLLALTALAWLSQPLSKIQGIVSQIWGHDTRDQPLLFLATFQNKVAWHQDRQLVYLVCNSLLVTLLCLGLTWSWLRSPSSPPSNNNSVSINNCITTLPVLPSSNKNKVEEIINNCLVDFSLEEIYGKPLDDQEKFRRLLKVLPLAHRQTALELLLQNSALKTNFPLFLKEFKQNNSVPPMTQAQAIKALGNLSQEDLTVAQYHEKFHLLSQRAGLDPEKCSELFFEGLKPELLSVLTVRGRKPDFSGAYEDLKDIEGSTTAQKESMGNLSSYNLRPRDKNNRSSYLLLSSSFPILSLDSFISLIDTGAMSNYISLDLAQSLNVETVQCSYITLANGTNIKSFITKEKVLVRIGTFSFHSRFRVVKGLTYGVIFGYGLVEDV